MIFNVDLLRVGIKLLSKGGASEDDILALKSKYNGTQSEYVNFSKAMNLPQQWDRVTVDGLENIGSKSLRNKSKAVAKSKNSDIIKAKDVSDLEQAKKRDHKIFITESAIDKVDFVKPTDFTDKQASLMMSRHKELLNVAKTQNNSNEVLFIESLDFSNEVRILGDEFVVSPGKNPFAVSVIANAKRQSLVYLHNHPSTNTFSVGDIDTFVCERAIKAISVVTNQGEVYILNKLDNYSFDGTRKLLTDIYNSYPDGEIDDRDFVKKFLKRCREGGIEYAKSK